MYITEAEYTQLTGRDGEQEAVEHRIRMASTLLDARIGQYVYLPSGWKLDVATLPEHKASAVKSWTAQMVALLFDNNDHPPKTETVRLGRFSVTEHGQTGQSLQEQMLYVDSVLVSARMVKRQVRLR